MDVEALFEYVALHYEVPSVSLLIVASLSCYCHYRRRSKLWFGRGHAFLCVMTLFWGGDVWG